MLERKLEVFLAVALSKGFAKAAEMLNVTPSSVSKELKLLEEELGMLLVDRQKGVKGTKLTPAGESFLPLALKWQEIQREIANSRRTQPAHFLSIAGCETAVNNLLPDIFNDLLDNDPPVLLEIVADPTDMLYEKVETREVDVAFVVHLQDSKLVKITPAFKDEMIVARYEEEADRQPEREIGLISPEELDPDKEFYNPWSPELRLWHQSIWNSETPQRTRLMTAYLVPRMLDRRGRWAIVPKCAMADYKSMRPEIGFYRLTSPPPFLIYYHITHKNPKISAMRGLDILNGVLRRHGFFDMD
jgi:Transcriptional regulator